MKQQITTDQLLELSDNAKHKLNKWVTEKYYKPASEKARETGIPQFLDFSEKMHLSIGQMIEFLDGYSFRSITKLTEEDNPACNGHWVVVSHFSGNHFDNLCDALWEACKEVLEK